jgi:hypothetical protein
MASKVLSTTPEQILVRNLHRKSLSISNEDASIAIFIKRERAETPTVSATDHDHRIGPGGSFVLNYGTDGIQSTQDSWSAVAESGTPRISVVETEDIQR